MFINTVLYFFKMTEIEIRIKGKIKEMIKDNKGVYFKDSEEKKLLNWIKKNFKSGWSIGVKEN